MAPRRLRASTPEFPSLEANGLYASDIRGDGNCLFNALSDQLYGHQEMHQVLREATIEHMRSNADFYIQYMAVNTVRRNPKRKTASAASRTDTRDSSQQDSHMVFMKHLERMGQTGEWADNMEVSAFASALNIHVRLWQADYHYVFSPREFYSENGQDDRQTINIAYHTWEHYSSVRNKAGPHIGLPDVSVTPASTVSKKRPSPTVEDDEDYVPRARKRRSPLPVFDSDSTPEGTESSSDESNGPILSHSRLNVPASEPVQPRKLTIKLRGLKTADLVEPAAAEVSKSTPLRIISTSEPPAPVSSSEVTPA